MPCRGVVSPGCAMWGDSLEPPLMPTWWGGPQMLWSSSGRFTPLSFHGLRSALKLRADSMEISEDLETLLEPLKKLPLDVELFFLRSRKDEMDVMLPGFLSRSKMVLRSRATSSPKAGLTGESAAIGAGACWSSRELKYWSESSNESDLGRRIDPLTMLTSMPAVAN